MKRTILLMALLLLTFFPACSSDTAPEQPEENPDSGNPPLDSVDSATAPAATEIEPAPTATPAPYLAIDPTAVPNSYPAEPASQLNLPPYPATGTIWILRPLGQQCQPAAEFEYATVEDAILALNDAGITVYRAEQVLRPVCEACDCPSSEHYRLNIDESNLAQAQELGWELEE